MVNRKKPEPELDPEPKPQFLISDPAPEGYLISAPRLSAQGPGPQHYGTFVIGTD